MTDVKDLLLTNFSNQFSDKFLLTIVSLWFNDGNHVYKVSHVADSKQRILIIYLLWYLPKQCVVDASKNCNLVIYQKYYSS